MMELVVSSLRVQSCERGSLRDSRLGANGCFHVGRRSTFCSRVDWQSTGCLCVWMGRAPVRCITHPSAGRCSRGRFRVDRASSRVRRFAGLSQTAASVPERRGWGSSREPTWAASRLAGLAPDPPTHKGSQHALGQRDCHPQAREVMWRVRRPHTVEISLRPSVIVNQRSRRALSAASRPRFPIPPKKPTQCISRQREYVYMIVLKV
ncbi:hypothetical protein BKA62DRAFT_714077 [Auriculariales sp. MPI-PUGE-AT-0066]|nr:hypothetical protein BKA62DRAFT_714077 [Auriculariales sp. MPI-PUGE-AT-0066]